MPTHHGIVNTTTRKVENINPILGPDGNPRPLRGAELQPGDAYVQFDVPEDFKPCLSYKLPEFSTVLVERSRVDLTSDEKLMGAGEDCCQADRDLLLADLADAAGITVGPHLAARVAKIRKALA